MSLFSDLPSYTIKNDYLTNFLDSETSCAFYCSANTKYPTKFVSNTQDFEHQKFTKLVLDWWNRWSFELNWYAYFWKLSVGIYQKKIFWNCSCCFHQLLPHKQISSFAVKKSLDFSQTIESYKPLTVLVPLSSFSRLMLHACDLNLTTRSHAAHTFIILVFVHQTSWQKKKVRMTDAALLFFKHNLYLWSRINPTS